MPGYYRFPTICGDTVVFVCDDDLWTVPASGGIARRLTSNLGAVRAPSLSPDGQRLAFTGSEEGPPEVYCMPAQGGEARRLSYQGAGAAVVGWSLGGEAILYSSGAGEPHWSWLWRLSPDGGNPERLPFGPAQHVSFGPGGGVVLGRMTRDPASWKRYRGGTAGRLLIDAEGSGEFGPLAPADGNFTTPMWIGERIYFISDHEGIGNVYSCLPSGEDLRQHTRQTEYYARSAQSDGRRIVYHAGADLFVYDIAGDAESRVEVDFRSPRTQRQRRFVSPGSYLGEVAAHPDGHALALTVRGKPFTMANWEGAVLQHGERDGVRYRLTDWLNDGKRLVTVSDAGGEEALEIRTRDGSQPVVRLEGLDIGRPEALDVSPTGDQVALSNHRFELLLVDPKTGELRRLDRSEHGDIAGFAWSPDGRWIAYALATTERTCSIKVCRVESGETWQVTPAEFHDYGPAWDPEGKYLYFLSHREYNPVYDHVHFDLGFPQAARPLLVTLRPDVPNPFVPEPRPLEEKKKDKDESETKKEAKEETRRIEIEFAGIEQRVVVFPFPEGRYGHIDGIEGKVLLTSYPIEPTLPPPQQTQREPKGTLHVYDFREQKKDTLASGIDYFVLSRDRKALVYRAGERLRVLKAGDKPGEGEKGKEKEEPGRRSGWVDLGRVKASVVPAAEWRQMYREAWRLQRDYFWSEDMSGVDWERVYRRYLPLLDRLATRAEFSDLMWEMQGELGTSHAYEFGGDYRPSPDYVQGFLGADFAYDEATDGYRITHVVRGDPWEETRDSPLNEPGINVGEGDVLLAIGGLRLGRQRSPGELLVNQGGQDVELLVRDGKDGQSRTVTVKALRGEREARYREWVSRNRAYVHEQTGGRVGYVHIPDMMGRGFAEFHRGYLAEISHPGLIVDVRFNGGGHVSPLILEKLARRRIGYDVRRWGTPIPYPYDSAMGPMVALCNELAGSDGDIFSHCFKLMKLGALVGTRTWGGVVGISPHSSFVDGGLTTQPGYSFWFADVGWRVENYGTDPDVVVECRPQDFAAGVDPQLDRAIALVQGEMEENPPRLPDFGPRPRRALPT
ncbi:MAG: PDZ domain-containing protein [Candidatus Latescibacterota bacterium]